MIVIGLFPSYMNKNTVLSQTNLNLTLQHLVAAYYLVVVFLQWISHMPHDVKIKVSEILPFFTWLMTISLYQHPSIILFLYERISDIQFINSIAINQYKYFIYERTLSHSPVTETHCSLTLILKCSAAFKKIVDNIYLLVW